VQGQEMGFNRDREERKFAGVARLLEKKGRRNGESREDERGKKSKRPQKFPKTTSRKRKRAEKIRENRRGQSRGERFHTKQGGGRKRLKNSNEITGKPEARRRKGRGIETKDLNPRKTHRERAESTNNQTR